MAETKRRIIVDGIDFPQLFQFPILFRAITLALSPSRLVLALLMVAALAAAGGLWDANTGPAEGLAGPNASFATPVEGAFSGTVYRVQWNIERLVRGVLTLNGLEVGRAVADTVFWTPLTLWQNHPFFTIVFGALLLVLSVVCGGAISRMTAAEIAGIERLRMRDALEFSMSSWLRLLVAPIIPLVGVVVLALIVMFVGMLTNFYVLDLIAGAIYGLMLLLGLVIAVLLIGYIAAGPMLIPAIACENCDATDAMHRCYQYVLSRPLHLLGYWVVSAIALALGFLVVAVFAWLTLNVTGALFSAWTGSSAAATAGGYEVFNLFSRPAPGSGVGAFEALLQWLIGFWEAILLSLVAAFFISFVFNAATIMYLLMRRVCDGQAIEEVWRPGLVPGTLARMPAPRHDDEANG